MLEVLEDPLPALLLVGGAGVGAGRLRRHGAGWASVSADSLALSVLAEREPASQGRVKRNPCLVDSATGAQLSNIDKAWSSRIS